MDAAARLAGKAVRTPLLRSAALDARTGATVLLKSEVAQRTGSFKFRGAMNRISRLDDAARKAGVVAYSSGNHAQAVAAVAQALGAPAVIVMPSDAPAVKIARTRAHGAEIVLYDRATENREEIAQRIAAESGATLVPPFDDPYIIAGQGTVGLEIADDMRSLGLTPDAVLVPCSGGGLVGGIALAVTHTWPSIAVYAVEPAGFDDTRRSLASGTRVANEPGANSICDALLVATPGALTFSINIRMLAGAIAVTDDEVLRAMAFARRELGLAIEPGGAVSLAALLAGRFEARGRTVVSVLSGGNVDEAMIDRALAAAAV
jgi:threonine dehydratase